MGREIERKFLVTPGAWHPVGSGTHLVQGYLSSRKECVVRVRIEGSVARLTIKGANRGAVRSEFEYPLPLADAETLLAELCEQPLIDKHRHREWVAGRVWEVDVFHGENDGLIVAEVELPAEDAALELPPWVGREVTGEPRYYNSNLLRRPYRTWRRGRSRAAARPGGR